MKKKKHQPPLAVFRTSFSFSFKVLPIFLLVFFIGELFALTILRSLDVFDPIENIKAGLFFSIPVFLIFIMLQPVKVFDSHMCGYRHSGLKAACDWEDIAHVKLQKILWYLKYIKLIDGSSKVRMVIPYKGLHNWNRFKEAVATAANPLHPLVKFLDEN